MTSIGWGRPLEDEVTYNKRVFTYPSSMVAIESLLIPSGPYDGSVLFLLELVDIRLALLLGLSLIVEMAMGCVDVKVRGDDTLIPIDKEER